jgi:hypothetical protein
MASARRAVLVVGYGRSFVVEPDANERRIIITAAHCIENALLANGTRGFPRAHLGRYQAECTYKALLAPIGSRSSVWAECIFVDPVADIAVLGQPDNEDLSDKADAYDELVESMVALAVADAPAQGRERVKAGNQWIECPTPGKGPARVLSLEGRWLKGQMVRHGIWLSFEPDRFVVGGMSGSPIIDHTGAAVGVLSTGIVNPVIADCVPAWFLRKIMQVSRHRGKARPA